MPVSFQVIPAYISFHVSNAPALLKRAKRNQLSFRAQLAVDWQIVSLHEARKLRLLDSELLIDRAIGALSKGKPAVSIRDATLRQIAVKKLYERTAYFRMKKRVERKNKKRVSEKVEHVSDAISKKDLFARGRRAPGSYGSRQ